MSGHDETTLDRRHLRREARTALELAIVALAPTDLIDRLAAVTGLMEALCELPADSPPARALVPGTIERAQRVLADWRAWETNNLHKGRA